MILPAAQKVFFKVPKTSVAYITSPLEFMQFNQSQEGYQVQEVDYVSASGGQTCSCRYIPRPAPPPRAQKYVNQGGKTCKA